jgi:hypothetical protein
MHRRAEADVGEELDEIGPSYRRLVDQVLALGAPDQPSGDRHFAEVELRPAAVFVVEYELDLAVVGRFSVFAAREEDVVGLLGAKLRWRERARRPDDGVGNVRLARAVRADDDGNPWLEIDLERTGEGFEAADLDGLQVHRRRILAKRPDVQMASGTTPRASSACRAASCSAAFFVEPRPTPSWTPATCAAQTKRRSCGGPSTSSTV